MASFRCIISQSLSLSLGISVYGLPVTHDHWKACPILKHLLTSLPIIIGSRTISNTSDIIDGIHNQYADAAPGIY